MSQKKIEIKHIILPFDFSEPANNALQHAITFAKNFKADLTLVSVMDSQSLHFFNCKGHKFEEFEPLATQKLTEIIKESYTFNKIEFKVTETKWDKIIHELVDEKEGPIIILGNGAEKNRDGFFTVKHAHKIVDSFHVPLIIIKEDQLVCEYKVMIAPLDETPHTREKLPYLTIIASAYNANVSIVGLEKHHDKETAAHMQAILKQASLYLQSNVKGYIDKLIPTKNEIKDLLKTALEDKADLIVIMNEHYTPITSIFAGSYAQQITDKANVPVLLCPTKVSGVMGSVSV